ncbi:protein translocase subunit SecF [Patescibacteria group bacterium]|nr:protein translocase subunit SecF [Patescibacteria group bacterium]MBU1889922.1 protein translocase subunit SecF [Patescibacteria group bacterium]
MYQIIKKSKIWYIISAVFIVPGIVFILLGGLKLNIDFTGGTLWKLNFDTNRSTAQDVSVYLEEYDLGETTIQPTSDSSLAIRMKPIDNETRQTILTSLNEKYEGVEEESFESIGPTIGDELKRRAMVAIIIVLIFIILYINWAFRKISKSSAIPSWAMGLSAIAALAHDILFVVGAFAFMGHFFGIEVGALFVTALLTILGFSVHDTIVVYDRVRENVIYGTDSSFEETVNRSVNQTIVRSLNTSFTTLFVLLALYLFGGESIRMFVFAMILGIVTGTYSSIFIASPLLVIWQKLRK